MGVAQGEDGADGGHSDVGEDTRTDMRSCRVMAGGACSACEPRIRCWRALHVRRLHTMLTYT